MKVYHFLISVLFCVFLSAPVAAQQGTTATEIQKQLNGKWLGKIEDDPRARSMTITGAFPKSETVFAIEATYGFADGRQDVIVGEFRAQEKKLTFLTPAKSQVQMVMGNDGFDGTFTSTKGEVKKMSLVRATDEELQAIAFPRPGSNVPESCSAFYGGWDGQWSVGTQGPQKLWVVAVQPDCKIKYSYRSTDSNAMPTTFRNAEIKDGVMTVGCGNGGTCIFKRQGDQIWGTYNNPSGGTNTGVFRKIQ